MIIVGKVGVLLHKIIENLPNFARIKKMIKYNNKILSVSASYENKNYRGSVLKKYRSTQ